MLVGLDRQDRVFVRLPVELPVEYLFVTDGSFDLDQGPRMGGTVETPSGGGLLLRTAAPPIEIVGELLSNRIGVALSFELPDGEAEPVWALATVARVEGVGLPGGEVRLGLRFQEITMATRDRIMAYVVGSYLA